MLTLSRGRVRTTTPYLGILTLAALLASPAAADPDLSPTGLNSLELGFTELIYDLSRSVVVVEASHVVPSDETAPTTRQRYYASGLVIDSNGHILVSASTVEGYDDFLVAFENQRLVATIVAVDYCNSLALLRVGRPIGDPVTMSPVQSCAGHFVVGLGTTLGLRAAPSIGFCAGSRGDGVQMFTLSQANAGSGVFSMSGQLFGIVTAMGRGAGGTIAEAIPAYRLPRILRDLKKSGDRHAGWLGAASEDIEFYPPLLPVTHLASIGAGHTEELRSGALLTNIKASSPAATAGLRPGDVVISVGRTPVRSSLDLSSIVRRSEPGSAELFTLVRGTDLHQLSVTIGKIDRCPKSRLPIAELTAAPEPPARDSLLRMLDILRTEMNRLEEQIRESR